MRKNNNMTKSTATNPTSRKWAYSDYVTVLEGPGLVPDASGYPFVKEIVSSTLYSVDSKQEKDFDLIPTLRWNLSTNAYDMYAYDQSQQMVPNGKSYTPLNGRIEIPWSDVVGEESLEGENTFGFYNGARIFDETNYGDPQISECGIYFRSAMFDDQTILRVKPNYAGLIGEEPWQVFIYDLPEDFESLYTGVVVDDPSVQDETMLVAVFSEKTDSFSTEGEFLKLVSGEDDLNRVWFGGKLYPLSDDNYNTYLSPVLITRETTGLAKTILHGDSDWSGSGLLKFMPVDSISVNNKDSAIMYPYGDYEFVNGSIQRKSGVDQDTYMSLSDDPEPFYHLSQEKSSESTLPDGWIVVDYKLLQEYYYIYIGDDEDVTGKADAEFKTEWDNQ